MYAYTSMNVAFLNVWLHVIAMHLFLFLHLCLSSRYVYLIFDGWIISRNCISEKNKKIKLFDRVGIGYLPYNTHEEK